MKYTICLEEIEEHMDFKYFHNAKQHVENIYGYLIWSLNGTVWSGEDPVLGLVARIYINE